MALVHLTTCRTTHSVLCSLFASMKIIESHTVPPNTPPARFSDYVNGLFQSLPSRKGARKAIEKGAVLLDGKPAETGRFIRPGQRIEVVELITKPRKILELKLPVIYEDDHLAVINKPGGIAVSGNFFRTVENALPHNLQPSPLLDAYQYPRPVHRLDSPTSGLLIIAKTVTASLHFNTLFEQKNIQKRYQAVAIGKLPENGIINFPIEEKDALTKYEHVRIVPSLKNKFLTLVNLFPQTGRTHQLRIHLSQSGYPILGDKLYGRENMIFKGKGLFLCAVELSFQHPTTHKTTNLSIHPPNKFNLLMQREKRRWEKVNE